MRYYLNQGSAMKPVTINELSKERGLNMSTVRHHIKECYLPTLSVKNGTNSKHFTTDMAFDYFDFLYGHKSQISSLKRKCKIITIANSKGGVFKTSTTVNLAASLAALAKVPGSKNTDENGEYERNRVLIIDFDVQGNASTFSIPTQIDEEGNVVPQSTTLKDLLLSAVRKSPITPEMYKNAVLSSDHGYDIITNNITFNDAKLELMSSPVGAITLKTVLKPLEEFYDYIIIDTPPSLSFEQINAYTASDYIIVVAKPEGFSLDGLEQTRISIDNVNEDKKQFVNPRAGELLGVLLTNMRLRTNVDKVLSSKIIEYCESFDINVFDEQVKNEVVGAQAMELCEVLRTYEPTSESAGAYFDLALRVDLKSRKEDLLQAEGGAS
jgi:chromosome partitioning protein